MSLKQQIDYALRDGIVSKSTHRQLISEPYHIGKTYNVNPFFFFKKSSEYLNDVQSKFLKDFKWYTTQNQSVYFVNPCKMTDQFQMMAAVLIRNFIPAHYYTVNDLVEFCKLSYENKLTFSSGTVFIPNIATSVETKPIFLNFLNFAMDNNVMLVLHFNSPSDISLQLSEYWFKVVTSDFKLIECNV